MLKIGDNIKILDDFPKEWLKNGKIKNPKRIITDTNGAIITINEPIDGFCTFHNSYFELDIKEMRKNKLIFLQK